MPFFKLSMFSFDMLPEPHREAQLPTPLLSQQETVPQPMQPKWEGLGSLEAASLKAAMRIVTECPNGLHLSPVCTGLLESCATAQEGQASSCWIGKSYGKLSQIPAALLCVA